MELHELKNMISKALSVGLIENDVIWIRYDLQYFEFIPNDYMMIMIPTNTTFQIVLLVQKERLMS